MAVKTRVRARLDSAKGWLVKVRRSPTLRRARIPALIGLLVLGLGWLLFGCSLQDLGNLGSLVQGIAGLATLTLAWWVTSRFLPQELSKFRATRREELRERAAEAVWMAVYRLGLIMRALMHPITRGGRETTKDGRPLSQGGKFRASFTSQYKMLAEAGNALLDAWGLANLYLDADVDRALHELWKLKGELQTNHHLHAINLDQQSKPYPDAWKAIFGDEAKGKLAEVELRLRRLIEPVARHTDKEPAPTLPPAGSE